MKSDNSVQDTTDLKILEEANWLLDHLYTKWYCPFRFDSLDAEEDIDEEEDEENIEYRRIAEAFNILVTRVKGMR